MGNDRPFTVDGYPSLGGDPFLAMRPWGIGYDTIDPRKKTTRNYHNSIKRPLTAEETKVAHTLLIRIASIAVGVWTVALSVIYFVL